jgi:hypothetical protein
MMKNRLAYLEPIFPAIREISGQISLADGGASARIDKENDYDNG